MNADQSPTKDNTPGDTTDPREPGVSGPATPTERVVIRDYFGDGHLSVRYDPKSAAYAGLTLSTHGHWSIDMTVDQLLGVIADAGGPDILAERDQARTALAAADAREGAQRARIEALIAEDSQQSGREVSCAGYLVTDNGCFAGSLARRIADALAENPSEDAQTPPTEPQDGHGEPAAHDEDERVCYSDECAEPCQSQQASARAELADTRRQLATTAARLGALRAAATRLRNAAEAASNDTPRATSRHPFLRGVARLAGGRLPDQRRPDFGADLTSALAEFARAVDTVASPKHKES